MKGDPVPDRDHISRYCSATRCTETGDVTGAAFMLRPNDRYLSVNWLEFLQLASREEEIREIRRVLSSQLTLGTYAKIAVLKVGDVRNRVLNESPDSRNLSVLHEPVDEDDPSHSGIYGMGVEDQLLADLIAEVILDTYPAQEPE
jgi:hypothetical protein